MASSSTTASSQAVRRLTRELGQLETSLNPQLVVKPTSESLLVWHFLLHSLPDDTPFRDGCYHGKLVFPEDYPHAAPSLLMLTPNGRLEVKQRLCLSMTDFHPESWNPAWSIESMLVGLISFMIDEAEPTGIGVVKGTSEARQRLAEASWDYNMTQPEFRELFSEFADRASAPTCSTQRFTASKSEASRPSRNISEEKSNYSQSTRYYLHPLRPSQQSADTRDNVPEVAEDVASEGIADRPAMPTNHCPDCPHNRPSVNNVAVEGEPLALPTSRSHSRSSNGNAADVTGAASSAEDIRPETDSSASAIPATVSPPAESVRRVSIESDAPECWICREDGSTELLIQPCACTGSMSGVHASCVEQWIRTHRENAQSDEAPHCSVCGQPYAGSDNRPGPMRFLRYLCGDFARQAGRSTLLVVLLVAYWAAAQPDAMEHWQPGLVGVLLRILFLGTSGTFFCYKATVLVVSLPRGRPCPENILRIFHIGDFRLLAVHIAEAMATVVIAGLWCLYGQLPYYFFLPLCSGLVILPLINILLRHESTPCSMRAIMVVVFILASPIVVIIHLGKLVYRNPKRLIDPLDGVSHVHVPIITIPLCWFCDSSVPVLVLWGTHSVVLIASLIELRLVQRLQWKEGRIWWIAMQLSVLAAYIGNLLHSSEEVKEFGHQAQLLVLGTSLVWLFLVCNLAVMVNWGLCVEQYRAWQQRNGSFALGNAPRAPVRAPSTPNAPNPETIGEANDDGSTSGAASEANGDTSSSVAPVREVV